MLTVWRIVKNKHARTAFSGEGARLYGGRWNSPRTAMVYAAQSQSLAILEMLVHLDSPDLLKRYVLFGVEIDEAFTTRLDSAVLPKNWKRDPVPRKIQAIGDAWAHSLSSAVLSVPSVLVPNESNFLINPRHPDFSRLTIGKPVSFRFDGRFVVK
jgi:RES domain-containing protein